MNEFKEKIGTHIVIKVEDIRKLNVLQREKLGSILHSLQHKRMKEGKEPCPKYYIINLDEPYAEEVFDIIKRGEIKKNETE
jgi:hypothetical protein